ncbi:MAG: site-2 protease family protein [Candidatus Hodarchaeales archaeon]|jgi:Zn-dependent protease/CBS domain-containing protein
MKTSFTLIRIRGISIELHLTFIGFLALLLVVTLPYIYPVLLFGILFLSVIIHELAHSIVAQRNNIPVKKITLYPIGGAAQIEEIPENPRTEVLIALAGPFISIIIGILSLGIHLVYPIVYPTLSVFIWTGALFFDVGMVNILLAIFNLLPIFPMDGGRALRAGLSYIRKDFVKATENAAVLGRFFALIMIFLGFIGNFWLTIIGLFIYIGATQEARFTRIASILKPIQVQDVMLDRDRALTMHPDVTVSQAFNMMYQAQVQDIIVCTEYQLLGVITWDEMLKVPSPLRAVTRIGDLNVKSVSIMHDNSVLDAYKVMIKEKTHLIPVVDMDAPCNIMGVITNQSIAYSLRVHSNFNQSVIPRQ